MDGNGCITHEFMKGLHRYHSGLAIWVYIAFFFLITRFLTTFSSRCVFKPLCEIHDLTCTRCPRLVCHLFL